MKQGDVFLLFKKHTISVAKSKEALLNELSTRVFPFFLVRYNFAWRGTPDRLNGEVEEDRFHVTANYSFFSSWQAIAHGSVRSVDTQNCLIEYRFFPDNFNLLFSALLVAATLFAGIKSGFGTVFLFFLGGYFAFLFLSIFLFGLSVNHIHALIEEIGADADDPDTLF